MPPPGSLLTILAKNYLLLFRGDLLTFAGFAGLREPEDFSGATSGSADPSRLAEADCADEPDSGRPASCAI